jgi:drug/metabolite transporter (DMT)-like permease
VTEWAAGVGGARALTPVRATLLVMFSACCFGSIGTFVTLATRAGAGLVDVLAWRFLIAAILLMVVSGGPRVVRSHLGRGWPLLPLAGGGQALIGFLSLSALRYIPVATMIFLFYSYPTWVAIISALRGRERLTGQRVTALALSLAGVTVMVGMPGTTSLNPIGVWLALGGALLYALYIPMMEQLGAGLAPAVTSTFATAGAAVILTFVALVRGGLAIQLAPTAWLAIGLLALFSTVLAFIAFLRGLPVIGPVRTAIVSTVEPFWGAFLASVLLAQPLSPRTLAGGMLLATAVIILNLPQRTTPPIAA